MGGQFLEWHASDDDLFGELNICLDFGNAAEPDRRVEE